MTPTVLVVDHGVGNLSSVAKGIEDSGARATISNDPAALARADLVLLPGVGAFDAAMRELCARGWVEPLREAARRIPLLGICLGMQLLGDHSAEGDGLVPGLGLVPGVVARLTPQGEDERIPHVGWNEVAFERSGELFDGVLDRTDFYFAHSYHLVPTSPADVVARSTYCGGFVAAVARGSVLGCQFHPEKSSHAGRRLLANFVRLARC